MIIDHSTIAAIATAPGVGGIAIIRISGQQALHVLNTVFLPKRKSVRGHIESHRMYYGHLLDSFGQVLDEVMAVYMAAPNSYTKEDVVEIHCHGGGLSAQRALKAVFACGVRPAEPGEFTKRAFLNGRLDLSEAEGVMQLIAADSESAARNAVRQMRGGVSSFVESVQQELTDLLSMISASTDFPDEVDEIQTADQVREGALQICETIANHSDEKAARMVREGAHVVLVGKPNVGKSSLMNAFLNAERAIVTDVPGTTRDVLSERISLNGIGVTISDTAGQRQTQDPIEKIGVDRAEDAQNHADVVLLVLDGSRPLSDEDRQLMEVADERWMVLINQQDRPQIWGTEQMPDGVEAYSVSAKEQKGIDQVISALARRFSAGTDGEDLITAQRHLSLCNQAVNSLQRAIGSIEAGLPLDVVSSDIWEAAQFLSDITGGQTDEQVIDRVFAQFCVGK